ncbi:glutaminase [Corynebacterium amycolatum]|uniref:glutaminase n=1 Tax=Corynebacterium amycolatum TaxID=43765 RepID=UPI003EDEACFC
MSEIVESVRPDESGEVADYIPTLAQANPDRLALAMTTVSGRTYTAGDTDADRMRRKLR